MRCPHCSALQGENVLKPDVLLSNDGGLTGPVKYAPDLLVIPRLDSNPSLGGVALTRLSIRSDVQGNRFNRDVRNLAALTICKQQCSYKSNPFAKFTN